MSKLFRLVANRLRLVWWLIRQSPRKPFLAVRDGLQDRQLLLRSGLVDEPWYRGEYEDVQRAVLDPLDHFVAFGLTQKRDPNPLFDTAWYLAQYPEVAAARANPLVDYLTEGAGCGRDPNPLFDSDWYLQQYPDVAAAGLNPLAHYLSKGAAEGCDPHPLFDSDWYAKEYPDVTERGWGTPLADYVRQGAAEYRYPSPLFDPVLYVNAHTKEVEPTTALRHFLLSGLETAPGAYRSVSALIDCQRRFHQKMEMRLHRDRRSEPRQFAVCLQCGAGSLHEQWLTADPRSWDLIVNHYDPTFRGAIPCEIEFHQTGELAGTKFTAVYTILNQWPDLLDAYDYLLLLDDDITLSFDAIGRLFRLTEEAGLALAQPSLSDDSYSTYEVFRHHGPAALRVVRGVEIMMPVLSRRALRLTKPLFGETISGWGLDYAVAELVAREREGRAAVIDDVIATHAKPIDFSDGAYYRMLKSAQIYPEIELRYLRTKYEVGWWSFDKPDTGPRASSEP